MNSKQLLSKTNISRSENYANLLATLGNTKNSPFSTLKGALTFCALLGFNEGRKTPLGAKHASTIEWHVYMDDNLSIMFALALAETNDPKILSKSREPEMVQIYEEYANGGLSIVDGWLEKYNNIPIHTAIIRGMANIGFSSPKYENDEKKIEIEKLK